MCRETIQWECLPPTRYVMGAASGDDLYRLYADLL